MGCLAHFLCNRIKSLVSRIRVEYRAFIVPQRRGVALRTKLPAAIMTVGHAVRFSHPA